MRVRDIIIGQQYKDILVTGPKFRRNGETYYVCKCVRCGKVYNIRNDHIGATECCQDCKPKDNIINLSGRKFGRLTAIEYKGRKNGRTRWLCRCDCGKEVVVGYSNLMNGITKSCGCLGVESRIRTGHNNRKSASSNFYETLREHPLYGVWSSMLTRCYNPNSISYKDYGGRGVTICERWLPENLGFQHFVEDMGERPSIKHTIDRIDVNGSYCPENCRWASPSQQANNKRDSVVIYYHGKRLPLTYLCDALGLNYSTVAHQLQKGFDINTIIEYGGADFRRKGFKGNTDKYKTFNKNITIFVPQLFEDGTELAEET